MTRTLYLMPTSACNCRCDYCYERDLDHQPDASLEFLTGVLEDFLAHADRSRPPQLRFIGGEPYCRPDLLQALIARFCSREPDGSVLINSNGTLLTEADLTSYLPHRERVVHVLSLDGPRALHDSRRHLKAGGSAFARVVAGIRALRVLDLPVHVNAVLDEESARTLPELVRLVADDLGLDTLAVSLLASSDAPMSIAQKADLLASAYEAAGARGLEVSGHHRLLLGPRIPGLRCRAGEASVLVANDEKRYACQRFVGKQGGLPVISGGETFVPAAVHRQAVCGCYTAETEQLADRLMAMYRAAYPAYLEVSELDRILYGTLE